MKNKKEKIVKECACRKKYTLSAWKELKYIGEMTGVDGDVWEMRDCVCESTLMIQIS